MYPEMFEIRIDGYDDDPSKKFYAGQVIEGKVVLGLGKEKVTNGIVIRLIGKGNVFWDTTGIKHNNVFRESETYVNTACQLMVPEDGRQTILPPGPYEYFFSFQLPENIPSSIEGQHCFIRYSLEASVQRPWKDDQVQEMLINVISISDLNNRPETAEPSSFQRKKLVGLNICQTGPIILNFMIGKTGFVSGEYLQYGLEIRNTSTTRINRIHVSLKRQLKGHAKGETKSSHDKILTVNGPSCEVGGYLLWQNNFEIPNLIPSELFKCTIIRIQYYVEIKLVLEKWVDLKFTYPIIIGTVPVKPSQAQESVVYKSHQENLATNVMSRKNSVVIKSPINGEEFQYNVDQDDDEDDDIPWGPDGQVVETTRGTTDNEYNFFSLPPLDLTFFQSKPERNPYFKCYEDSDYESSYPLLYTANNNVERPRPHSNPHFGRPHVYWENNDD